MFLLRNTCNISKLKNIRQFWSSCNRLCSVTNDVDNKQSGYAKAYTKFENINAPIEEKPQTFASLLRNSKFVDVSNL